ncbi:MAG: phosphoribosyltransferase family protein [Buchananella hordeovulneris]|nr:phosphoribosyltransferase family protein [Buchananella hordeovulneris]
MEQTGTLACLSVAARAWLTELAQLLAPQECAGCGQEGQSLCPACTAAFGPPRLVGNAAPLPVFALAEYDGTARALILAYKERRRTDLDAPLEQAMRAAGRCLAGQLAPLPAVLVVPAPSGWRRRWRGALVSMRLATALAQGIGQAGAGSAQIAAHAADLLRRNGGGNQSGQGARGRSRQRRARIYANGRQLARWGGRAKSLAGRAVVLVDDVATTGATLQAARWELERLGAVVVAAVALAAVPK